METDPEETEELVDVSQDQIQQSSRYKGIPKESDNRERHIIDVICFNTQNMILRKPIKSCGHLDYVHQ